MKKDKIHFRKFDDGDVIALFPKIEADNCGNILSYMRVGQHGAASSELIKELKRATPLEYKTLKAELLRIGYNL